MRIITFLVCLLMAQMAFSQIEKKNMTSGELTLVNNDKILFKDLTWKNDKAFYINANNNQAEELFDASIKTIEEKEITIAAPLAHVPTKNEEKKSSVPVSGILQVFTKQRRISSARHQVRIHKFQKED